MISIDSKSYPYLAIAQHYNVDYSKVLLFSDRLEDLEAETVITTIDWQFEVFKIWMNDHEY